MMESGSVGGGLEICTRRLFCPVTWTWSQSLHQHPLILIESKLADGCVSGIEATFVYCIVQQ